MDFYNKHYIRTDDRGAIIYGFSDAFEQPQSTDICINEQGGRQFHLMPNGTENPPLLDMHGIPLYKWDGEEVIERAEEERQADIVLPAPPQPTPEQRLNDVEGFIANFVYGGAAT